jgi:hypothetical protein
VAPEQLRRPRRPGWACSPIDKKAPVVIKPQPSSFSKKAGSTDGAKLKCDIVRKAKDLGADLVGVAPVARWREDGVVPQGY